MDGAIGFLATLSWHLANEGHKTTDPRWQAPYLNMALVDDFPSPLPQVSHLLAPGRVPFTGNHNVFIHNQNIAMLAQLVILHSHQAEPSFQFSENLKQRICRLLLIMNDYLDAPVPDTEAPTLEQRREICLRWLRNHQYGIETLFFSHSFHDIARQLWIYELIQSSGQFDVELTFQRSTGGVKLSEMYQLLAILLATVNTKLGKGAMWLPKSLIHHPTSKGAMVIGAFASKWIRSPEEYRKRFAELTGDSTPGALEGLVDVQCLRESPFVEGRQDQVAIPCLPFVKDLVRDAPYFIVQDRSESEKEKAQFRSALGEGFSLYVERLLARIAAGDKSGPWQIEHRVGNRPGQELADSLLYKDHVVFIFEHKGQRPGTKFLSGHASDLVLGPSGAVLDDLEAGREINRAKAKHGDKGMLTHGMWQQSDNGPAIVDWVSTRTGRRVERAFPVHVNLHEPRVDSVVRGVYIDILITAAGLYSDEFWAQPQWLLVTDLEALAAMADDGNLDVVQMFSKKDADLKSRSVGFDEYLNKEFGSIPWDKKLAEYGMREISNSSEFFHEE